MHRCVSILGVRIDIVTMREALERVFQMLTSDTQHHIMTPNPEMLVRSHRDPAFRALLNASSLNIPDGTGLLWAAKRSGQVLPERVTGIDLLCEICLRADVPPVFLLGAAPGVAEKAADVLRKKNPSLRIAGTLAGSPGEREEEEIVSRINASGAKILFVAYGAPQQDVWIRRNLRKMPSIAVAMGVGGAFDFLAGHRMRAPKIVRSLWLEWLWRLIQEPHRFGRMCTAVIVFPLLVLTHRQHSA